MLADVAEQIDQRLSAGRGRPRAGSRTRSRCSPSSGPSTPQPLVPPELRRADAELERGLRFICGGAGAVAAIDARL